MKLNFKKLFNIIVFFFFVFTISGCAEKIKFSFKEIDENLNKIVLIYGKYINEDGYKTIKILNNDEIDYVVSKVENITFYRDVPHTSEGYILQFIYEQKIVYLSNTNLFFEDNNGFYNVSIVPVKEYYEIMNYLEVDYL